MEVGRFIRAKTIASAWHRGINLIWRGGEEVRDERGTRTRELIDLLIVVKEPFLDMVPKKYSWKEERLEDYAQQLISGHNPGFEYTYGERLRAWRVAEVEPVDQIDYVIRRLKASSETRRATATTWIPPVDASRDEVPCMILDDFKIRSGRLHLSAVFRSHDFAGAYPANLFGLARLLEYVSLRVGIEPGTITTLSISAHIYEHDWDWVSEMLLE